MSMAQLCGSGPTCSVLVVHGPTKETLMACSEGIGVAN